jgi:hypothetical protein
MRRWFLTTALGTLVAVAAETVAHEGHEHKHMGKVVSVQAQQIEVETKDGKKVTGVLGPETKYLRGKAAAALADVKVGERVVILVVEERKVQKVKQVLLGEEPPGGAHDHLR